MTLNYSLPGPPVYGNLFGPNIMANLEKISLTLPSIGNATIRSQRINETLLNLAKLFENTNGTADTQAIADYYGTSTNAVTYLESSWFGHDNFVQTVLWASRYVPTARNFYVQKPLLALIILFLIISYVTTGIRLYSRWRLHDKGIRHVDYCLVGALIITTIISADFGNNIMVLANDGTGSIWFMTYNVLQLTQIHAEIEVVVYHLAILLIKLSILIFYAEMTHPLSYQRMMIYFVVFIAFGSNIAGFFFQIFKCDPIDWWNHWTLWVAGTICVPYRAKFVFAIGIANIITDCMIWAMPIPTLFMLQVSNGTRLLSLIVIFSSSIACIFSVFRVRAIWFGQAEAQTGNLADFSTSTYSQVEMHTMIWAYNVPAIRALCSWYLKNKTSKSTAGSHNGFFSPGTVSSRDGAGSGSETVVESEKGRTTPAIHAV